MLDRVYHSMALNEQSVDKKEREIWCHPDWSKWIKSIETNPY